MPGKGPDRQHYFPLLDRLKPFFPSPVSNPILNDRNYGPVTLFRVYPEGVDPSSPSS